MKRFLLLFVFCLVGCQQNTLTQADYLSKVQTALTTTEAWLKVPNDSKQLDQAIQDCQLVIQPYAQTEFDTTPSMKGLKLMKLALMLCKVALDQGASPDTAPDGSQSPADSVRQAKQMVEAELQKEKNPGLSPSPSAEIP